MKIDTVPETTLQQAPVPDWVPANAASIRPVAIVAVPVAWPLHGEANSRVTAAWSFTIFPERPPSPGIVVVMVHAAWLTDTGSVVALWPQDVVKFAR